MLTWAASSLYLAINGPVSLNASSSSEIINEVSVSTALECLSKCMMRDCVLVAVIRLTGTCQLVTLNDASVTLGPPLSHVRRVVGSEAGARVWKVGNFDHLVRQKQAKGANITLKYINTNTGRNGSIQQVVINITGCYGIEVAGARGGHQSNYNLNGSSGALVKGNYNLTAGTQVSIVVGQMGGPTNSPDAGAGGGGGSFVYVASEGRLLIAAGGGGGASSYSSYRGKQGEAGVNGSNSNGVNDTIGFGGINGQPGYNNPNNTSPGRNHGGCGAGWLGKAVNPRRSSLDGDRGGSMADGWVGGQAGGSNTGDGGFGGGGGGGETSPDDYGGAAGGGGGYSGGGAGVSSSHAGGGGGSYCGGLNCSAQSGGNTLSQHGFVVLHLAIPFADTC